MGQVLCRPSVQEAHFLKLNLILKNELELLVLSFVQIKIYTRSSV